MPHFIPLAQLQTLRAAQQLERDQRLLIERQAALRAIRERDPVMRDLDSLIAQRETTRLYTFRCGTSRQVRARVELAQAQECIVDARRRAS